MPPGIVKLHFGAFGGSIPGLVQQSAGTLDLHRWATSSRARGIRRRNRGELCSHRCAHGRHADHHQGGLHGSAGLQEPGLHHGHERSVDGQRGLRDVTSSGTSPLASNTLIVTNTSDFSNDLFLTKNWAGWSKLQVSNNSAAFDSGPELRLLGNQSARVFLRDGGTTSASSS